MYIYVYACAFIPLWLGLPRSLYRTISINIYNCKNVKRNRGTEEALWKKKKAVGIVTKQLKMRRCQNLDRKLVNRYSSSPSLLFLR